MSSRFFVPPEQIKNRRFVMLGSEARHAAQVLRHKVGDVIDFFDGADLSYRGRIESISADRIEGAILSESRAAALPKTSCVLYQALVKGPRWDWLVEKSCEVGASRLVPLLTARTLIKPGRAGALERWKRIALSAAKQCGRSSVMEIGRPVSLQEALQTVPREGLSFIPWEKETTVTLRQAYRPCDRISLFIGPEGGWEAAEVELAQRHGVRPVTLGPLLLRSETAGLVALAQLLAERGE